MIATEKITTILHIKFIIIYHIYGLIKFLSFAFNTCLFENQILYISLILMSF